MPWKNESIVIASEGYWARLRNWLAKTQVGVKEPGLKAGGERAESI